VGGRKILHFGVLYRWMGISELRGGDVTWLMFLHLAHKELDAYRYSSELTLECYRLTKKFPVDERFAMVQQIRRAALSVHLNLPEGCSRKSEKERKRFFEIATGSLIEVDTAIGIALKLSYVTREELIALGNIIIKSFKLLSGMIRSTHH
jgi:four helix bundle protein